MTDQQRDKSVPSHKWHFRPMGKAEINLDPIQGEFFTSQDIADRLVRETLQNSLDAAISNDNPVTVRFTLQNNASSNVARSGMYFSGLRPHLEQSLDVNAPGREELDDISGQSTFPYLLIEDFNTKGLTGDVQQYEDLSDTSASDDNHFYWFVRNVGRSGKRGLEGGSWGVGKYVFPDASKINTFFFLTSRVGDSRALLMGQSVLKMHILNDVRHYPYGHYADIEEESEFALPIDDQGSVQAFEHDFGLTRGEEKGLSIVIPFPEDGIDRDSLLRATIRYYFSPILSGRLLVRVADESDDTRVDYDSIYNIVNEIDWGRSRSSLTPQDRGRMFDLVQNLETIAEQDRIAVGPPEPHRNPTASQIVDRLQATDLENVRTKYESGEAVTFRLQIWVHQKNEAPNLSWIDLAVQRDSTLTGTHTEYVRNDLTIPEAGPGRLGISSNFRSLLVANEDHIAALLRDSEEPSHSRWNERAQRVRDHYKLGASTVRFVNGAVRHIVRILTMAQEGVHRDLLNEFFRDPGRGISTHPPPVVPPGPSPSLATVTRRANGFSMRAGDADGRFPKRLRIQVAYQTRRGNPLNRYDPLDFTLDSEQFTIEVDRSNINEVELNQVLVEVESEGSGITVDGFDPNRDLLVQVDEIT